MTPLIEALDRACPGFVPGEYEDLPYMWVGGFVRHFAAARLAGRLDEVRAVFAVIEATLAGDRPGWEPSPDSNLAVTGFLEDLQNDNLHPPGSAPADFVPYLGPRALDAWDRLNGFWQMVAGTKPK